MRYPTSILSHAERKNNRRNPVRRKILSVVLGAVFLATVSFAQAQQPKKVPRIGFLGSLSPSDSRIEAFRQGLRDLGYLEGKNIVVEYRYAEGKVDRFPDLVAEVVRIKVDIIVVVTAPGARAAKNATKTIPLVMLVGVEPVDAGLVESFARPGGNITGVTSITGELGGKRLELLKEAVPKLARVAVLYDPANPGGVSTVKEVQNVAHPLGLTVRSWEARDADGLERVFAALIKERPGGLLVAPAPLLAANEEKIAGFAIKSRLPSMFSNREAVDAGGLMSYGADLADSYRRVAYYVDRILKGAKPADLPVEQPTKFELVINLKTAKQIGLTIPQSLLYRADKVIK